LERNRRDRLSAARIIRALFTLFLSSRALLEPSDDGLPDKCILHSDRRNVSGRRWPASGTYPGAFCRDTWRGGVLLRFCRKPFYYLWPRESDISPQAQTRHRVSAANTRFFIDPRGRDLQARGDFFGGNDVFRLYRIVSVGVSVFLVRGQRINLLRLSAGGWLPCQCAGEDDTDAVHGRDCRSIVGVWTREDVGWSVG
jgi:hypothetical protein